VRTRDADNMIARVNPVDEGQIRHLDLEQGEEELLAAILAEPRPRPVPSRNPVRHGRRLVLAVVVVLLALAALVVGLPGGEEGEPRAGLAVLDRVAAAAAEQPVGPALPNGYLKTQGIYVNSANYGGESWAWYQSETAETWAAPDGSGSRRSVSRVLGFVTAADREAWQRAGKPVFLAHGWGKHVSTESFGPGTFDGSDSLGTDVSSLPTDPEELSRRLIDRSNAPPRNGFPPAVRVLTLVADLLQNPFVSSDLRSSLYEAVARVPGIEYLGATRDQLGRRGIAVGARSANSGAPTVYSLIVDPDTSEVLATEQEQLQAPAALPQLDQPLVISSTAYLESRRTASIPGR
jgi:hypothetical protein